MKSSKPDGGAAFPSPGVILHDGGGNERQQGAYDGMTLRQYFAAHAPPYPFKLPEIFASDQVDPTTKVANAIARWNYAYADSMLTESDK